MHFRTRFARDQAAPLVSGRERSRPFKVAPTREQKSSRYLTANGIGGTAETVYRNSSRNFVICIVNTLFPYRRSVLESGKNCSRRETTGARVNVHYVNLGTPRFNGARNRMCFIQITFPMCPLDTYDAERVIARRLRNQWRPQYPFAYGLHTGFVVGPTFLCVRTHTAGFATIPRRQFSPLVSSRRPCRLKNVAPKKTT